mmetsp:Transcript_36105/g.116776  ORF Transcript_36105/g.116776 Transcript_36105/m.116776 type:complete len:526 (-) Transcript_36105:820-2397(-)
MACLARTPIHRSQSLTGGVRQAGCEVQGANLRLLPPPSFKLQPLFALGGSPGEKRVSSRRTNKLPECKTPEVFMEAACWSAQAACSPSTPDCEEDRHARRVLRRSRSAGAMTGSAVSDESRAARKRRFHSNPLPMSSPQLPAVSPLATVAAQWRPGPPKAPQTDDGRMSPSLSDTSTVASCSEASASPTPVSERSPQEAEARLPAATPLTLTRRMRTTRCDAEVLAAPLPTLFGSRGRQPSSCSAPGQRNGCKLELPTHPIGSWRKGAVIGSGSYGSVVRAQDSQTGGIFAVKQAVASETGNAGEKALEKLKVELDICRGLKHPNIVSYLGQQIVDGALFIFMEYMAGGSISSILKEYGPLSTKLLQQATRGAVAGLDYLHGCSPPVVHRDIKGANLLVDVDFCVKLADFGCSKQHSATTSFTTVGSIPWMAPEVILHQDGHGRKADIWSLGCTVLEMATAETPWGPDAFDNVMFALMHIAMSDALPPVPDTLPAPCRALLEDCLCRDPTNRPSADALLRHGFLQ